MSGHQTTINKSDKLKGVCYDIRGPVLREAHRLEDEGHRVIKLNIGNPAPFGLKRRTAWDDSQPAGFHRLLPFQVCSRPQGGDETQTKGIENVTVDDIIIGNGVSERS